MSCRHNFTHAVRASLASTAAILAILIVFVSVVSAQRIARPAPISPAKMFGLHQEDPSDLPFFQAVPYPNGAVSNTDFLAVADVNGDGKPDLILIENPQNGLDGAAVIMLGNGDGTFQPAVVDDIGIPGGNSVAIGDLNHDGKPDLIVASSGWVSVLIGKGDGSFKPAVVYPSGGIVNNGSSVPPLLADLNNDGKLDVVVVNQTDQNAKDGSAAVLLGNGDGTLQPVKTYDSGGFLVSSIAVADLNSDGAKDLVVVNCAPTGSTDCPTTGGTVGVLLGKGDGTFRSVQSYPRSGEDTTWAPVAVADVNNDGMRDLLVGSECKFDGGHCAANADGMIGIYMGNGDGTFRPAVNYPSGGPDVGSIVATDIYGDGKIDLVIGNWAYATVLRGNGDGTFRLPDIYLNFADPGVSIQVADVNGDGKPDLIASGHSSALYTGVLLGNGNGFSAPFFWLSGGWTSNPVGIGDVNSDGHPDLIAPNFCDVPYCTGDDDKIGVMLYDPAFVYNSTITQVTATPDPAAPNQPVTYTVTVSKVSGSPLTGTVECWAHPKNSYTPFFQGSLVNNQAIFTKQYGSRKTLPVECQYSGDSVNIGSISRNFTEYIRVLPVSSTTQVTSSGSPSHAGDPVTFTAKVTSGSGDIPDGEQVTFYDGTKTLGPATLSGGTATLTTSSLSAKKHTIKVVYAGDSSFKTSRGVVIQIVQP